MDLLKLFLVDDEAIILKGLSMTYDWAKMGFEIAGTARDGDEAVAKINEIKPDVVLTDIRMKRMDGLTLMAKVAETLPEVNFVVISAYKDFEYAKIACNRGALAYLVKPIDDAELYKTMSEVASKCQKTIHQREVYEHWHRLLVEDGDSYLHMMRGRYLNNGISKEEYIHIYKMLKGTGVPDEDYAVVCADMDIATKVEGHSDYDAKRYVLSSELEKLLREEYTVDTYQTPEESPVFILHLQKTDSLQPLRRILSQLKTTFGDGIISAISNRFCGIDGMREAYVQGLKLYELAMASGAGMLRMPKKLSFANQAQYSADIENQIISAMRKCDENQLRESFVKFVYQLPGDESAAKIHIHRLIVRIEFWLRESCDDRDDFASEFLSFYDILSKYPPLRLVDAAFKLLNYITEQRAQTVDTSAGNFFADYMQVAVDYIEAHLPDENLSITEVAGQIFLNPVYFGRVFKSTFGVSFKRYVLNARIERAKEMIMDDALSIAVICDKVGIPNPSYFTKLFKQCTGQLPSDYKRNGAYEE